MCMLALFLLQLGGTVVKERVGLTLELSLVACVSFALSDILVQHWTPRMGFAGFMFPALAFGAFQSVIALPALRADWHALVSGWRPALLGATFNVGQGLLLTLSIAIHHDATTTNILYGLRGVWSLLLVFTLGAWFRNTERALGHRILGVRLAGAVLMSAAVVVALRSG
jgi:hypothetical protein